MRDTFLRKEPYKNWLKKNAPNGITKTTLDKEKHYGVMIRNSEPSPLPD
jgi:hypothetical protein